ncbi:hypothetical protein BDW72DRAFT_215007 [Aspergillus terricola var. indicus]
MSRLECLEPDRQDSSLVELTQIDLGQANKDPLEDVGNREETEAYSSSEEFEVEETRHVGPCHLGLALSGFLERHTEGPWEYLPGGHHPVHLGDRIGEYKQFKVIHKLGSGGFGNVWLCSWVGTDPAIYVAIKILKAEWSGEDCREQKNIRWLQGIADRDPEVEEWCLLPWKEFTLEGPNGTHQCFVYEVAASGLGSISHVVDDVDVFLRKLTRQAAEAMSVLHRHNICHGDFRPSNILFRVNGLDGKSEEEVIDILGEPEGAAVVVYKNAPPDAHPPRYILNPVSWRSTTSTQVCCHQIRIADFGESFIAGNPPPHGSGIPFQYAAPEVALDEKAGKESDIFALAATIYEIRFGNRLFRIQEDSVEAYVHFIVKYCGKLPEIWWPRWRETWKKVTEPANEDELQDESTVRLWHIRSAVCEPIGHRVSTPESWAYPHKLLGRNGAIGCHELIPVKEKVYLADLLYRMTALDPRDRITIDEVLEHRWFRYEAENSEAVHFDRTEERNDNQPQTETADSDALRDQAIKDELPRAAGPDKPREVKDYNSPQLETTDTGIHNKPPRAEAVAAETVAVQQALVTADRPMEIDRPEPSEPAESETLPSTGASELQPPKEQKVEALTLHISKLPAADAIRLPESGKPQSASTVTLQPTEDAKPIYNLTNLSPVHEVSESTSSAVESFRSVKAVKSIPTPVESAPTEEDSTAQSAVISIPQPADEKPLLKGTRRRRKSRLHSISVWLRSVGRAARSVFA